MKSRRILFVNSEPLEIETMRDVVNRMGGDVELLIAHNGREALDMLMGANPAQGRPNMIVASTLLTDMSAFELFSIVRKYYSLVNLKFLLLTDRASTTDSSNDPFQVDGYLHRPLRADQATVEQLSYYAGGANQTQFALLSGLSFHTGFGSAVKTKLLAIKGMLSATKIAIGLACIVVPGVIAVSSFNEDNPKSTLRNSGIISPLPETVQTHMELKEVKREAEPVLIASDEAAPNSVMSESLVVFTDTTTIAEIVPEEDSTEYPKTFSIGVRESSGTKKP